jgi:hypothetical protein
LREIPIYFLQLVYPSEFKTWEFGKAAAPGLKQRSGIEAGQLVSCPMQMASKMGMAGKPKTKF